MFSSPSIRDFATSRTWQIAGSPCLSFVQTLVGWQTYFRVPGMPRRYCDH